ncbi:MAG: type VI secretion system tip protein VgrG [Gammaproteobacteria bacterium HGW-Gammaproteobacteria-1]|jgi:type VI secretion system secreted protein VgrG|nr:MAG: type VI secretion system tip protein VgrG [Gammaproteobacteria bacterium HGW-Gammaproteobacteria-1]
MDQYTQDSRLISIDTKLGKDELLLTSFEGAEHVSNLFEYRLAAISTNHDIKPEDIIGEEVTVTINTKNKVSFHGFINTFSYGEMQAHNMREYRFTMVPWLWFLSRTENRRIFQNKNTKDIVSQIFSDLGFKDFEFKAQGGVPREYCVQYGESDLHFVSRLLEEEGIAYYFKQEAKKHTLVLVDQKNAYEMCIDTNLTYSRGSTPDNQITRWSHNYEFRKGVWTLNDYNFKEPAKSQLAEAKTTSKFSNVANYQHYEYPAVYDFPSNRELVNIRMDAEEVPMNSIAGASTCSTFYAGGMFKLDKHEAKEERGTYLLISVTHSASDSSYYTGEGGSAHYRNTFTCIPSSVHFRPLPVHKRPVMRGPQSAMVTGPAGEEIYIDEFGRIKVQFIWDREGQKDENSSCFLRVMQSWAGNQWGTSFIPRIGHEVIVSFLDGDPDRPIVTGTVYNGANKPVYSSKTQSGIKTRSTKNGTAANFNELRFEDKKGSEQVYLHAEKNLDTMVENDETLTVDHDRTKLIKHDENSTINHDRNKTVDNNQTETIGKNKTITVGDNHKESIGKNKTLDVADNHDESIGKNMTISVGKNLTESVEGMYTETVTKDYSLKAKTITMEADTTVTIKTGAAKIVMKSNGDITMSGNNINIKGSGNVIIKGSKVSTN